ncbi:MAG: hypothetical protein ACRDMK_07820 [Gaiellaceae bacterium]
MTPAATVTSPVIIYGLPASVHVVFVEIVPDTFVAARAAPTTGNSAAIAGSAAN